ncbi:MAG: MATE family efflux transporter [Eubacteriales bacterium]|nr:MATE family efflux transporter [Eubacteriales bacterium]
MKIKLSDHFTYGKLLRFTFPTIVMMIFTSIYGIVDGFFVSNFAGKEEFTAVNFIMPYLMILGTLGFMFGSGGSALIGRTLGEGDREKANRIFSLIVYVSCALGVVLAVLGIAFLRPVAMAFGAEGKLLEDSVLYGTIILFSLPAFLLQFEFQSFFVTAEKPKMGLFMTVVSGVLNMVLDLLLVGIFPLGLVGAAAATAVSQAVGGAVPLFYFAYRKNKSLLRLTKTKFDGKALLKVCTNGSSELMTNISLSVVSMLYNLQLLKYDPENGIAAYGVLMYAGTIFVFAFVGYSVGVAPVVSFHFGAGNRDELKNLLRKSLVIISGFALSVFLLAELSAKPFSLIFVGYDETLLNLTVRAFIIYSFSYIFAGFAIFGSAFFTALNNGRVSASISFLRTLVFQVLAVFLIPLIFGLDGIWAATALSEIMAVVTTVIFLVSCRKKYGYF